MKWVPLSARENLGVEDMEAPIIENLSLLETSLEPQEGVHFLNDALEPQAKPSSHKGHPIWKLRFDGSKCKQGAGAGIELVNPQGVS